MTIPSAPIAWMYLPSARTDELPFVQLNRANMDPRYWEEVRLYHPSQCDKLTADLTQARADLATLRAAIAEAVRRADSPSRYAECFSYEAAKYVTEPLRNLTKPEAPSERIMSDKDRENPVEGAHPTQPEGEGKVATDKQSLTVEIAEYAKGRDGKRSDRVMVWVNQRRTDLGGYCIDGVPRDVAPVIVEALASRGLVRGEGVER